MTSSPTATRVAPAFHCRGCQRELTAHQATLEHCRDVYATRPAICRGALVPTEAGTVSLAVVQAAIARSVAILDFGAELVGGDQLVPGGAGERLGQADAGAGGEAVVGHEPTIATSRVNVTSNRDVDGSPKFARGAL